MSVTIRKIEARDEARWRVLWDGYCRFYERELSESVTQYTWKRIMDGASPVHAIVAVDGGGQVIGVIPSLLVEKEVEHRCLTQLHEVGSMHERKALMEQLSDAFVVLPGGFGTLDEACEILTWAQLGLHAKPLGLANTAGYYDLLTGFLDHAQGEDFISATNRRLVRVEATAAALLDRLIAG